MTVAQQMQLVSGGGTAQKGDEAATCYPREPVARAVCEELHGSRAHVERADARGRACVKALQAASGKKHRAARVPQAVELAAERRRREEAERRLAEAQAEIERLRARAG